MHYFIIFHQDIFLKNVRKNKWHEKIDHLIMHQQQELIEIQKVQIEMMNDILERIKK